MVVVVFSPDSSAPNEFSPTALTLTLSQSERESKPNAI
jgi:hypothetical protein